jgi:hypothetical protein
MASRNFENTDHAFRRESWVVATKVAAGYSSGDIAIYLDDLTLQELRMSARPKTQPYPNRDHLLEVASIDHTFIAQAYRLENPRKIDEKRFAEITFELGRRIGVLHSSDPTAYLENPEIDPVLLRLRK